MSERDTFATYDSKARSASPYDDTSRDFIRDIVREDIAAGKHEKIVTRFILATLNLSV